MPDDVTPLPPPSEANKRLPDEALVRQALENPAQLPDIPDFSQSILQQLQADSENPVPCQYDVEFLTTYVDQQFHLEITDSVLLKQRVDTFEKHLPACPPCHQQLGSLNEVNEQYRQHLYRLEAQLEWLNLAPRVLAQLQTETAPPAPVTNVIPFPGASAVAPSVTALPRRRGWPSWIAGSAVAAVLMLGFVSQSSDPLTTLASKSPQSVNVHALEQALRDDARDPKHLAAAPTPINVVYESPEAYLFSPEGEMAEVDPELLTPSVDVSAVVIQDVTVVPQ